MRNSQVNKTWHRLRRWGKRQWLRIQPHAIILVYHRIADLDSDPQLLAVSPHNFAQHLELLSRQYRPVRLKDLEGNLGKDQLARRFVAVTFDDGYADNLHNAKPLLERYNTPATIFVTSGAVGQPHEFWWDELDRLLLQPGTLPENLYLDVNGAPWKWRMNEGMHYRETTYQLNRNWSVERKDDPTPRQHLYRSLCSTMRPLHTNERQRLLSELQKWAGADPEGRLTHRALTADELACLSSGDLTEIGAHTVSHPALSEIPLAGQQAEIQNSKYMLEKITGKPVTSFSYPYGTRSDYTPETVKIVQDAMFDRACSNFADIVRQDTDCFQLPRFLVRNWSKEEFASRLQSWFSRYLT